MRFYELCIAFTVGLISGITVCAVATAPEASKVHVFRNQAVEAGVAEWQVTEEGIPYFKFVNPCKEDSTHAE